MKKKKCHLCNRNNARRTCELFNDEMICSQCCGDIRNTDCEYCKYYQKAKEYQLAKTSPDEIKERHFIAEINEEAEMGVDNALALVEKGKVEIADNMLSKLNKKFPRNHIVRYGQGVVLAFKGDYEEAVKYFSMATDIFPYFPEAHFNKAIAYKNLFDVKNAVASFNEVIKIGDPQDEMVKRAKDFIKGMEKIISQDNNISLNEYLQAHRIFEKAFSHMKNQEWPEAIKGFKDCIMINKSHPQSYGNLGLCYMQVGKKEEAIKALDKALEIDPNYEPALVNRAIIESLTDDEKLPDNFMSIEYYKDFKLQNKSYLNSILVDNN